jgi:tetratricopeptide (TPR) repeat protein
VRWDSARYTNVMWIARLSFGGVAAIKHAMRTTIFLCIALGLLNAGCSVKRFAVNQVGNALAGSGTTFSADDDPELIKAALPFSLKLMESLLAESPQHRGLLLATSSGFTQYSYAFIRQDADELEERDVAGAKALRERAARLYRRARDYGLRGLETQSRGFEQSLRKDPKAAVRQLTRADVPLLYWTAASWGSLISLSKNKPDVVADQPLVEAMIDRALELDEAYDHGAIHSFLITYEMARSGLSDAERTKRARQHFEKAVQLSGGQQAGAFVSLAENVCVQQQKKKEFQDLLNRALAIDADARPEWRLVNLVMQRRARWLLSRTEELIVE